MVMDYSTVTGGTDCTFHGNVTYLCSGGFYLYGTTRFEGGTVIKYTNNAALNIEGTVECLTGPYAPAVLTAWCDDTIGETLPASSGNPSGYYASRAIEIGALPSELKYLRIAYAKEAVVYDYDTSGPHTLTHAQLVNCHKGVVPFNVPFHLRNVLMASVKTNFYTTTFASSGSGENLTIDQATRLYTTGGSGSISLALTNSLLVAVTYPGSYTGSHNATTSNPSTVFQTVGAGSHYLPAGSSWRGAGTSNIDPDLAKDLKTKTTQPPLVQTNGWITSDTTLLPRDIRDTGSSPDLGFHYDVLDQVFSFVLVSNCSLTISAGTAVGTFGSGNIYGLALWNGGHLKVEGTPANLVHVARYNLVQEQANIAWSGSMPVPHFYTPWWDPDPMATASFRFMESSMPASRLYYGNHIVYAYGAIPPVVMQDCHFRGGELIGYQPDIVAKNCLFEDVAVTFQDFAVNSNYTLRNNLFYHGSLSLYHYRSGTFLCKDNTFERAAIAQDGLAIDHGWNGYLTGQNRLSPTKTTDKVVSTFNFQSSASDPSRRFYLPTGSALINAGSQSASLNGLFHYTTTTDQAKEGSSLVDIGLHYIALNAQGSPVDTDGDSLADYVEDLDGNGLQSSGETKYDSGDSDEDGLTDAAELLVFGSDPLDAYSMNRLANGRTVSTDCAWFCTAPVPGTSYQQGDTMATLTVQAVQTHLHFTITVTSGTWTPSAWEIYYSPFVDTWTPWIVYHRGGANDLLPIPGSIAFFSAGPADDLDCDGLSDGYEASVTKTTCGGNCNDRAGQDSNCTRDLDGNGVPDYPGRGGNGVWDGGEDFDGDKLSNVAEMKFGKNPFVDDHGIVPRKLLVYYAYPGGINGSDNDVSAALSEFAAYDYVILAGRAQPWADQPDPMQTDQYRSDPDNREKAGLEEEYPDHPSWEHPNHEVTKAILDRAPVEAPHTLFFGYIALSSNPGHLNYSTSPLPNPDDKWKEVQAHVDWWKAMKVDGIFFDEFGFDYLYNPNTGQYDPSYGRDRQNDAVGKAHDLGFTVIANAYHPEDALGEGWLGFHPLTDPLPTTGKPSEVGAAGSYVDFYFYEEHQFEEDDPPGTAGDYVPVHDTPDKVGWKNKAEALLAYFEGNQNANFNVMSVTTTRLPYDQAAFYYSWYSAFLYGHEATGWGEDPIFSTESNAPYHERPTDTGCSSDCLGTNPGTSFTSEPVWNQNDSTVTRTTRYRNHYCQHGDAHWFVSIGGA